MAIARKFRQPQARDRVAGFINEARAQFTADPVAVELVGLGGGVEDPEIGCRITT